MVSAKTALVVGDRERDIVSSRLKYYYRLAKDMAFHMGLERWVGLG